MKNETNLPNHRNVNYRMVCLLMRYYLYVIANNYDLDVDLMCFIVVQFECAHLNIIENQGQRYKSRSMRFIPRCDFADEKNQSMLELVACGISF